MVSSGALKKQLKRLLGIEQLYSVLQAVPDQATFLRGASPGEDPAVVRELEALSAEELETRCRRNGLSRRCLLLLSSTTACSIEVLWALLKDT